MYIYNMYTKKVQNLCTWIAMFSISDVPRKVPKTMVRFQEPPVFASCCAAKQTRALTVLADQ
jgi:hypothetical protein